MSAKSWMSAWPQSTRGPFQYVDGLIIATCASILVLILLVSRWTNKSKTPVSLSPKAKSEDGPQLNFSSVTPYKATFELHKEEPIPYYRQDYIRDYVYTVTMAIQKLDFNDWVVFDKNYEKKMEFKRKIVQGHGVDALDCRDGGYEGCVEMLERLVEYLPRRFPTLFTLSSDGNTIFNHVTKESFDLRKPYEKHHPLYIAGRLIEDDLNILVEGPKGEYLLKAVLSAFPAGFLIQDKMDKPLSEIHKSVPLYKEKLAFSMDKYFRNVTPDKLVMRLNWSINDREELFLVAGGHLYENDANDTAADEDIDISQVQLRVERQVLRRLPKTKVMCMLTKTYLYPLTEIAREPGFAARLRGLLDKLPAKFAFYKRKPVWGKVVLAYLEEMATKYPLQADTQTHR